MSDEEENVENPRLTQIYIYPKGETRKRLLKVYLEEVKNYAQIRKAIVEQSKSKGFASFHLNFENRNKIFFKFMEKDRFPIINIDGFWEKETFKYVKERLLNMKYYKEPVKFSVEKIDQEFEWNPPKFPEILEESLNKYREELLKNVNNEMNNMLINDYKLKYEIDLENEKKNKKDKKDSVQQSLIKKHEGVMCNNCLIFNPTGKIFVCAECPHELYFLCEKCHSVLNKEHLHNESHEMIQLVNPIIEKANLKEMDNIISPCIFYLENNKNEIKFEIVNTSTEKIEGCFIQQVRHGERYLSSKRVKIEGIEKDEKREVKMEIIRPKNIKEGENKVEGYFRMFTKEGLPFGEIIKVFA